MKIGIDFDDVLVQFDQVLLDWHNKNFGTTLTREKDITTNLEELFQANHPETLKRILHFYKTSEHAAIIPVTGAAEATQKLAENHELYIVSARPTESRKETDALIEKYFPNTFSGVYFTNHFVGQGKTKGGVCKELGIDIFIDDRLENAVDIAHTGIPVLLLDQPWNRTETPKGVKRVFSWNDIIENVV